MIKWLWPFYYQHNYLDIVLYTEKSKMNYILYVFRDTKTEHLFLPSTIIPLQLPLLPRGLGCNIDDKSTLILGLGVITPADTILLSSPPIVNVTQSKCWLFHIQKYRLEYTARIFCPRVVNVYFAERQTTLVDKQTST